MVEVSFGEWVKRRRKALGLTQEQLAHQISCSTSALRKIESEERRPSLQIVEQLANAFHLPFDQRASFLKFARGDWQAAPPEGIEQIPEHVASEKVDSSSSRIHLATFLFTDIENSSKLWEREPEKMKVALQRHHAILQEAITANGGSIFQIVGDAFCAVFPTAPSAISAAERAQRALYQEPWDLSFPIRVRMGIHTGEAEQTSNKLSGGGYASNRTLNRVARILSAAHGGQVLLSLITEELVRDSLPANTELRDMGEHQLRNLLRPEHLFQLTFAGLPSDFPPLNTLDSPHHNLPVQLTSFVGREKELADILKLLEGARMVTLIGPGGTGKTRLSIQAASEMLDQYPDGVWFVEFAPIFDPLLVPHTTSIAIGLRSEPQRPVVDVLCDYLRDKKLLLVLDNCEHLVAACARLADQILHAAPKTSILASSREALGIGGEVTYRVPSLELPDVNHLPSIESLSQYEAVRLFIDRARSAVPSFTVTNENAPALAQICFRLDGIPLALELAAAKIHVLSVEQIAKRLDDRFRLLTGGSRTVLERHQTLRAAIDWSYNLLSDAEQVLFQRSSVFVDGWTLEAAESVCEGGSIQNEDVLNLLEQLIHKSLVLMEEEHGESRYHMLETIRQYAHEKLLEAEGVDAIREKHLAYFVRLTEEAAPELYRSNQVFWLSKLEADLANLRRALEWALNTNAKSGLRIMVALRFFWEAHSDFGEVKSWLAPLLERYREADSLRSQALVIYARILAERGDLIKAQKLAYESLDLSRAISDRQAEAFSLWGLAVSFALQGDLRQAVPLLEQSLVLYQSLGDKFGQATIMNWLSSNNNDLERSKAFLLESLRLFRELGHLSGIAICLGDLANGAIFAGDFSSAVQWIEEARTIYRKLGSLWGEGWMLGLYGRLAYWQDEYKQARAYYEEFAKVQEKAGTLLNIPWSGVHLAYIVLRQGDYRQAKEKFNIAIQQFQRANNSIGIVFAVEGLASLNVNQNQLERAAPLFAWADAMREQIGDHRPPVEQNSVERDLAVIHSKMDDAEFARLAEEGRAMTIEQAIALALETVEET